MSVKKEKGQNKRNAVSKRFFVLGIVGFVFVIVVSFGYFHLLHELVKTQIYETLEQVTIKDAEILKARIHGDMEKMKLLATSFAKEKKGDKLDILHQLNQSEVKGNFLRIAMISKEGQCYTMDGKVFDVHNERYFKDAMQGDSVISDWMVDRLDQKTPILIYSTPIKDDEGNIIALLTGVQNTDNLIQSTMDMKLYKDSFTILLDGNGHLAMPTQKTSGEDRQYFLPKQNGGFTTYHSTSRDMDFLVTYVPIHINNWVMSAFVPTYHVAAMSNDFNTLSTLATCVIALCVLLIFLYLRGMKKKNIAEKEQLLFQDTLTKGFNYNWFQIACEECQQMNRWMLLLDIYDFGMINRMYGYPKGDALLQEVAQILMSSPLLHCPVRMENDHFIAWIEDVNSAHIELALQGLVEMMQKKLQDNCSIRDIHIVCGYAKWAENELLSTIVDKARMAMRHTSNNQPIMQYQEDMMAKRLKEKELEEVMKDALSNDEFKVYIQPKVDAQSGKITGGEALVRWQKDSDCIMPQKFIPLFERNGFLQQVDFHVYQSVCIYLKKWEMEGFTPMRISFNVSPTYIFQKGYIEKMCALRKALHLDPKWLEVEITESAMVEDEQRLATLIKQFHEAGYRIAMDDFGSGYSSLHMLKELPIDTLKIDKDFFVQGEEFRQKSECIVAMIMEMAQKLDMEIVAEGIETQEQYAMIQKSGAHLIQGYYFYPPMPIHEFEELIRKEQA